MSSTKKTNVLGIIGPGILVAATGVGAGDLATGAFTGANLGVAVLWAVLIGAFLKFVLTEGLARWQLATGDTVLEGCFTHFRKPVRWIFFTYLLMWSFFVGVALIGACGVTAHAILPVMPAKTGMLVFGVLHSLAAFVLVRLGGYRLFEKTMGICIGLMFIVVVTTAAVVRPDLGSVTRGMFIPLIPDGGLQWTIALMGGIGGTLTILCYGYWIREEGREGPGALRACRIDLAVGYTMTAIFGLAMVIIGNSIGPISAGGSAELIVNIGASLEERLGNFGPVARWAFLIGAWGAVFSSMMGVWQSVPYLFADAWSLMREQSPDHSKHSVDTSSAPYRYYLIALAAVPCVPLAFQIEFVVAQKLFAVVGAMFIPMLAAALLSLNARADLVGEMHRNSRFTSALLLATLGAFLAAAWFQVEKQIGPFGATLAIAGVSIAAVYLLGNHFIGATRRVA